MSSAVRPTPAQMVRRIAVVASVAFGVLAGQAQQFVDLGQSPAAFAADSDATLRVVGWAFAIWGPIYLALIAYAVRQALPRTGESALIQRLGWPSVLAFVGIGSWILAAALDLEIATIVLIFGALIVLLIPLLDRAATIRALSRTDPERWLVVWPLALLAGWLTIAAPVNLITVATGNGDLPDLLSPTTWAIVAIAIVATVAVSITARLRTLAYPIPVAWGLVGTFAAEQARNQPLALTALTAAVLILLAAALLVFGPRPVARARTT